MGLYSLLGDDKFFSLVPEFSFLEEEGRAAHQEALDSVIKESTEGCKTCGGIQSLLRPVMQKFTIKASELYEEDPLHLESLADYITSRRGYRPNPIVLYYRAPGQGTIKLAF
jgi:hypothetical protein